MFSMGSQVHVGSGSFYTLVYKVFINFESIFNFESFIIVIPFGRLL